MGDQTSWLFTKPSLHFTKRQNLRSVQIESIYRKKNKQNSNIKNIFSFNLPTMFSEAFLRVTKSLDCEVKI